ncbi:uncharacterized protein BO96DRAFT_345018 [Aspergillus niger CBS 101883]|uniref:Uncharacterized protein n=2 Tax=Aspergillus niger TaxID=5061 RepID=A2QYF9_ASPNC|nr:uncharacterized protein BO96DRAFT_345018 [Aspergillus niger CBS 101883]XP_059601782.1 hypothetical protein An12g01090 [Aspergillus niger]PYH53622.1 hypothetical protein BO96DRAFT_345018 [Aspergillus niger CBS 101883]RDH20777.1 hypothetical protein M747DRAFT_236794 [Aspergillus niger ATCC 13496]CAK41039.1 hypothetical protein An12g01090 [Aspergillus niger]
MSPLLIALQVSLQTDNGYKIKLEKEPSKLPLLVGRVRRDPPSSPLPTLSDYSRRTGGYGSQIIGLAQVLPVESVSKNPINTPNLKLAILAEPLLSRKQVWREVNYYPVSNLSCDKRERSSSGIVEKFLTNPRGATIIPSIVSNSLAVRDVVRPVAMHGYIHACEVLAGIDENGKPRLGPQPSTTTRSDNNMVISGKSLSSSAEHLDRSERQEVDGGAENSAVKLSSL